MAGKSDSNTDEVTTISGYLGMVDEFTKKYSPEIASYRGETQDFGDTACIPVLFRKDYLARNPYFEKNLLDEMVANGISAGNTYLEKAINAQHDGFPSRLLDVSFNCLVALHFAVTPHYKYDEDSTDTDDGVVYMFHFDESFSAEGSGIVKNYEEIILPEKKTDWFGNHILFSHNFKFIEHMRLNERIKAQNGAFILFQGETTHKIPPCFYKKIKIPAGRKAYFREKLRSLFGIDNGTVYPEAYNLVERISEKSLRVTGSSFDLDSELEQVIRTFKKVTGAMQFALVVDDMPETVRSAQIRDIERKFLYVKNAFEKFQEEYKKNIKHTEPTDISKFKKSYDEILKEARKFMKKYETKGFELANRKNFALGEW